MIDPVALLCELLEAGNACCLASSFPEEWREAVASLDRQHLLVPCPPATTITCRACDEDHPATIEYDTAESRHYYYCPVAGLVEIDGAELKTFKIDLPAVLSWLARELHIIPPFAPRELSPNHAWLLGEAVVGKTVVVVAFVYRSANNFETEEFSRHLPIIAKSDFGLLLRTAGNFVGRADSSTRWRSLDLRAIARSSENGIHIDRDRLANWFNEIHRGNTGEGPRSRGRPSSKKLVESIYANRRARNEPFVSNAEEARRIFAEIQTHHSEGGTPSLTSLRRHLTKLRNRRQ
jgi:hypothetical protein